MSHRLLCPGGNYVLQDTMSQRILCPGGNYCPEATSNSFLFIILFISFLFCFAQSEKMYKYSQYFQEIKFRIFTTNKSPQNKDLIKKLNLLRKFPSKTPS